MQFCLFGQTGKIPAMLKKRICVVGLGLMGGSMALALKLAHRMAIRPFDLHLTLVDPNPDTLQAASHLADAVTSDFAEGVRDAEFVLLCAPVRAIISLIDQLPDAHEKGCLVMDLGSSKLEIVAAMERLPSRFGAIGGHPMCGRETAGFGAATPDLYRGKNFVLCPTSRTTPMMQLQAHTLLDLVGANPLALQAKFHDQMVASISHLPYVASAALMQTVAGMNNDLIWSLSASGFRDTSRISGTDATMMMDILLTNKTAVLTQIEAFQAQVETIKQLINSEDEAGLRQWLTQTRQGFETYKRKKPK